MINPKLACRVKFCFKQSDQKCHGSWFLTKVKTRRLLFNEQKLDINNMIIFVASSHSFPTFNLKSFSFSFFSSSSTGTLCY